MVEATSKTAVPSEGLRNIEGDGSNVNNYSHQTVSLSYTVDMFFAVHALEGEGSPSF